MRTIGIELCDEGILAAEIDDEEKRLFPLEKLGYASPGFVYLNESGYTCGREAEFYARIYPRYVSDGFWDQLSLRTSDLNIPGKPPPYSELAFRHLDFIWKRLHIGGPVDKIVFALPGEYLIGEDGDEDKIGLILGIVEGLGMPLAGLVDTASVAIANTVHELSEIEDRALYLDIHHHATQITVVRLGATVARDRFHRSRIGYSQILNELLPKLANSFLSQTAFDVHHAAATEQDFYNQSRALLETLMESEEGTIELGGETRSRKMVVSRVLVERLLEKTNDSLTQFAARTLKEVRGESDSRVIPIFISERIARLPGLKSKLDALDGSLVYALPRGAPAHAAAHFGMASEVIEDLTETPLTLAITLRDYGFRTPTKTLQAAGDTETHVRTEEYPPADEGEAEIGQSAEETSFSPSHIVFQGEAHKIDPIGFTIGNGLREETRGLNLPEQQNGVASEHCHIRLETGRLILVNNTPGETSLNAQPAGEKEYLKAGDILTIGSAPNAVELLLIDLG